MAGDRGWQIAECADRWMAVIQWCAAAKRLKAREEWIGLDPRTRAERLKVLVQKVHSAHRTQSLLAESRV